MCCIGAVLYTRVGVFHDRGDIPLDSLDLADCEETFSKVGKININLLSTSISLRIESK